jgi:hypothetical protein
MAPTVPGVSYQSTPTTEPENPADVVGTPVAQPTRRETRRQIQDINRTARRQKQDLRRAQQ